MYNKAAADIQRHMSLIANQISGLRLLIGYPGSRASLLIGGTGKTVPELLINTIGKAGAVCPVCQTGSTVYIRITDKL